jgi:hypothetical protein
MPNAFLSGRIAPELNRKLEELAASTGETKTAIVSKALAAYLGIEVPLKATGDQKTENLELEVAELKGAVKSLYEKFATLTSKIESLEAELEAITAPDNTPDNTPDDSNLIEDIDRIDYTSNTIDSAVDSRDNYVENEKANTPDDNDDDNGDTPETIHPANVTPTINDEKTFIEVDTAKAAKLTRLNPKKFTDLRGAFNRKLKKENQSLPEKTILERPIKMTPPSGVKIAKVPYDIFYVGQSQEGRNLWNLVPGNTPGEQISFTFCTDDT